MKKNIQIRFGDEDSASYQYFKTDEVNTKIIKSQAIDTINKAYDERGVKTSPFSLGLYMYRTFLVREYDNDIKGNPKGGIEFTIQFAQLSK